MNPKMILLLCSAAFSLSARNQPALQVPPANIPVSKTPMFISLGFDDNSHSGMSKGTEKTGGIKWVCDFSDKLMNPKGTGQKATFDGDSVRCTFYSNSIYMTPGNGDYEALVKWVTNYAYRKGHEIGNHTHSHLTTGNGPTLAADGWQKEIDQCTGWMTKAAPAIADSGSITEIPNNGAGIPKASIVGFRAPYLKYSDGTFTAIEKTGMKYDCSIEEGLDPAQDGTNFYWPYTLENQSPGHNYMVSESGTKEQKQFVPNHPGIWELPCYAVVAPLDADCPKYGIPTGLRKKIDAYFTTLGKGESFDAANGKLTGLDYNWYYFQEYNLSKAEALAVLKNTLDLRMKGNRCPMLLGVHSQFYTKIWNQNATNCPSETDRQAIIEEFLAYALKTYPDVRVVTMKNVMDWCETPVPLGGGTAIIDEQQSVSQEITIGRNRISLNSSIPVTAELFTASGRKVSEQLMAPVNGVCSWEMDASAGTYIVKAGTFSATMTISK